MHKKYFSFIFLFFLNCIGLYYQYHLIFNMPPQGNHLWRQTDSATFALNYFQDGFHFWKPRMHNNFNGDGMTAGEFTGLYYLAALFYKAFGFNDGWLRLINFSFFAIGLLCYAILLNKLSKSKIYSIFASLLLFTSPIIAFYSFNFLPDSPALGFVLMAWLALYYYFDSNFKSKFLFISILLFLTAGLLKVTMLLSFFTLLVIIILSKLNFVKIKIGKETPQKHLSFFLIPIVGVAAWLIWVHYYNKQHSDYLLSTIMPIWGIDKEHIIKILERIRDQWAGDIFNISTHIIIFISLIILTIKHKINIVTSSAILITILGLSLITILWFQQLFDHEYYFISFMIFPALILLSLGKLIPPKALNHSISLAFMIAILLYNVHYCKDKIWERYNNPYKDPTVFNNIYYERQSEIKAFLKNLGIKANDLVISIPDISPNASLYLMNQRGVSSYRYFRKKLDYIEISNLKKQGYQYLIISDPPLNDDPNLKPILNNLLSAFEGQIFVYKL